MKPNDAEPNLCWQPIEPDSEWDHLAGQNPVSGFMQSNAWAEFKRSEGHTRTLLGLFMDGARVGGASLLTYPHAPIVVCPEGPVLPWTEDRLCRISLRRLTQFVRESGAVSLRIEPHLPAPKPSMLRNWNQAPVNLTPEHTLLVDLTDDPERWRSRMHPKARYNLGLAHRHGITVEQTTETAAVREFYALLLETAARNQFFVEPLSFFLNLAASLFPSGMARILRARLGSETLSSLILVTYGIRATYLYGASSGNRRESMPNYALHWEAMILAKQLGCYQYDLYGNDPFGHPDHLYAGISRFKSKWGGKQMYGVGALDYTFYDRLAESIVERYEQK